MQRLIGFIFTVVSGSFEEVSGEALRALSGQADTALPQ